MVMISLRPYQQQIVDEVRAEYRRGNKRVALVSPTGSGKTRIFAHIVRGAVERGKRTLILAHREELIQQISDALDVDHSFIAAGYLYDRHALVHIASVQTLVRRLDKVEQPSFIVCDEMHHIARGNTFAACITQFPDAYLLAVTATLRRTSGEGFDWLFDTMVEGPTVAELIAAGYLSDFKIYGPPTADTSKLHIRAGEFVQAEVAAVMDKPAIMGSAVEHYRKLADGKQAMVFCYSVEHSKATAQAFRDAGYKFEHIDGGFDREARQSIIGDFRAARIIGLCSCELVSEGFDVPGIHCGILLRPTASEGLYLQQVGRCLRTAPEKPQAIIVDHVGNAARHGLPDEPRDWSLEGRDKRAKAPASRISVRICPQCFAAQRSQRTTCVSCGHEFPVEAREVKEIDGELVEIKRLEARREQGQAQTIEELMAQHIARGRSPHTARAWATHVVKAREKKHATQNTVQADANEAAQTGLAL